MFYSLYINGKELPLNEEKLKENYKNFVERIIAIPINQLHSEENKESRFGLREMGFTVRKCLSEKEQKDDKEFWCSFWRSLPDNEPCEEEKYDDIEYNIINNYNNSIQGEKKIR